MSETVPLDSVVLPPVKLPPVIFPEIVALSPVISCATTELMTVNPAIDRVARCENDRYCQYSDCIHSRGRGFTNIKSYIKLMTIIAKRS